MVYAIEEQMIETQKNKPVGSFAPVANFDSLFYFVTNGTKLIGSKVLRDVIRTFFGSGLQT